jgi:hypothetical protein
MGGQVSTEYNHSALITADSLIHLFYHQGAESYGQYYIGLGITFDGHLKPLSMRASRRINEHYKGMACPFYGITRATGTEYHVIKEPLLEVEEGHHKTTLRELDARRNRPICICKDCNIRFYPDTSTDICSICLKIRQAKFYIFKMAGVELPRDLMSPDDIKPTSLEMMGPSGEEINDELQKEYEDDYKRMVALLKFIPPKYVIQSLPQLQIISENILKLKERKQYSGNPSDDSTPPHDSYLEIDPPTIYTTLLSKLQACRREDRQRFFDEIITFSWDGCVIHQSSEAYTLDDLTRTENYGDYCNLSRVYRKYTEVTWEKYESLMKTIMNIEQRPPIRGMGDKKNDIERLLGREYTEGMRIALCGYFFHEYMTDDRKGVYNSYKGQGFADIIDFLLLLHRFENKEELRKSVQLTRKIRHEVNQPYAYPRSGCWAINIAGIEVRNLYRFNERGLIPYGNEEGIKGSLRPPVNLVGTGQETDTKKWFVRGVTDIRIYIEIKDCYLEGEFKAAIKQHRIRYTQLRSAHGAILKKKTELGGVLAQTNVTEIGEFLQTNEMFVAPGPEQAGAAPGAGPAPAPE